MNNDPVRWWISLHFGKLSTHQEFVKMPTDVLVSMRIQPSDYFDYKRLLRFTFPSMVMMVFTSLYNVVDGFFVSNFVGKTPFAAVNFIMPVLMILGWRGGSRLSVNL